MTVIDKRPLTGDPWASFLQGREPSRYLYLFADRGGHTSVEALMPFGRDAEFRPYGNGAHLPALVALRLPADCCFLGAAVNDRMRRWEDRHDFLGVFVQRGGRFEPDTIALRHREWRADHGC